MQTMCVWSNSPPAVRHVAEKIEVVSVCLRLLVALRKQIETSSIFSQRRRRTGPITAAITLRSTNGNAERCGSLRKKSTQVPAVAGLQNVALRCVALRNDGNQQ